MNDSNAAGDSKDYISHSSSLYRKGSVIGDQPRASHRMNSVDYGNIIVQRSRSVTAPTRTYILDGSELMRPRNRSVNAQSRISGTVDRSESIGLSGYMADESSQADEQSHWGDAPQSAHEMSGVEHEYISGKPRGVTAPAELEQHDRGRPNRRHMYKKTALKRGLAGIAETLW
ncbi:hypothetical protein BC829DRAFT_382048 [Chytridium lagenaria]|nr:hypothetical protein BC829DRAFT_382048 [Chytridium lagenaria]